MSNKSGAAGFFEQHSSFFYSIGAKAKVFADFGDKQRKEYEGTVSWIADEAEFTPKTILTDDERANQVYAVKIAVRNDGVIKLGMYGEVKF